MKNYVLGIRFACLALGPAILFSMIAHGDLWPVPLSWLVPFVAAFVGKQFLRWAEYRHVLGYTIREFFGAMVASRALFHVIGVASLAAVLGRSASWQRTDKFRRRQPRFAAVQGAVAESVLAVLFLAFAVLSVTALPVAVVSVVMAYGFLSQALTFAAAPLLSYLSARGVRRSSMSTEMITLVGGSVAGANRAS